VVPKHKGIKDIEKNKLNWSLERKGPKGREGERLVPTLPLQIKLGDYLVLSMVMVILYLLSSATNTNQIVNLDLIKRTTYKLICINYDLYNFILFKKFNYIYIYFVKI
jgi:hypothetical protein